jgi:hypothetical protein
MSDATRKARANEWKNEKCAKAVDCKSNSNTFNFNMPCVVDLKGKGKGRDVIELLRRYFFEELSNHPKCQT